MSVKVGKEMGEETVETLAQQLIRRMGRSQAMKICQANKWDRVLDHIKTVDKNSKSK